MSERIFVAGHKGLVGSAIVRTLLANGVPQEDIITRTLAELDLRNQAAVQAFFQQQRPSQVYLAAAKVGGIHANHTQPASFIYENLMIQNNIIQGFMVPIHDEGPTEGTVSAYNTVVNDYFPSPTALVTLFPGTGVGSRPGAYVTELEYDSTLYSVRGTLASTRSIAHTLRNDWGKGM
jgi:hypothetical protein